MSKRYYVLILLGLSLLTRFLYFGYPNSTVFDEVHFGKFVSAYYTHEYYYDIHPPLGKLIIAGFASFFDYKPEFAFSQIGDAFPDKTYMALRFLPSLAGSLLPLIIYLLALSLNLKPKTAFFAGLLVVFENAILTQSRLILMDSFLYLFGFLAFLFYLKYRSRSNTHFAISDDRLRSQSGYLLLFAVFSAFAISIKWTGLTFLALAGLFELYHTYLEAKLTSAWKFNFQVIGNSLGRLILYFLLIPLAVYFSIFTVHFRLLPKSGPGDAFMSPEFQKTLQGNAYASNPGIKPANMFDKFVDLNKQMYLGNKRLTATHPYGSIWYSWPLMTRPVYYWVKDNARIYYFGNPILWWVTTVATLTLIISYLISKQERNRISTFLLAGYFLNLLPFIGIKRVMFLYHYAVALIFAILILAYLLDKANKSKRVLAVIVIVIVLSFIYFAPLSYGLPLSPEQYKSHTWLNSWI